MAQDKGQAAVILPPAADMDIRQGQDIDAEGGALDLLKGIAPTQGSQGCQRWPADLLLRWQLGEESAYIRGRCKATNLCKYCQRLYVRETVEMLKLDASEYAPTVWSVFTAREHLTRAEFNEALRLMRRKLRVPFPEHEYFCQVEFQRRGALHGNLLLKGVAVDRIEEWYEESTDLWCGLVDAEKRPFAEMHLGSQWAGVVEDGVGALLYISKMLAHGLKAEQAPPIGWKGHRTSHSRGYLVRPTSQMRQEARASLRRRDKLRQVAADMPKGYSAQEIAEITEQLLEEDAQRWWTPIFCRTPEDAAKLASAGVLTREEAEHAAA